MEELVGATPGAGEEGVRQGKEGEEVDRNAWLALALKRVAV